MNTKVNIWVGSVAVMLVASTLVAWLIFTKGPGAATTQQTQVDGGPVGLGSGATRVIGNSSSNTSSNNQTVPINSSSASSRVFKIANGPVTGATFVQTRYPTTTLARYVLQENGHIFDQALDVPGSLPRTVSNTTIPGTQSTLWGYDGTTAYMQYVGEDVLKTVSFIFPNATSSKSVTKPVEVNFLPDNITALAQSPSDSRVAYAISANSASTIYVTDVNGADNRKLFTIGFTQITLSWPSKNTVLVATKRASGTPGAVFSANLTTGTITPVLYASGLSAFATPSLSYLIYQTDTLGGGAPSSYAHDISKNIDIPLSFNPIPEKCTASLATSTVIYCATPQSYFDSSYIDNWHKGVASLNDMIVSFTLNRLPNSDIIAQPGGSDGGEASDILEMSASPDGKYLLFIKKGDRSLWGVRLAK